jgi:ankyrin repeat protein
VAITLLDHGADIDVQEGAHGLTPLGWAAVAPHQQAEMTELLLSRGATIDIWSAAALGRQEDVARLLASDPALVNARLSRSDNAMTPLHLASWRNHPDVVRLLLSHGADRQAKTASGQTALEVAEREGYMEVAALLRKKE